MLDNSSRQRSRLGPTLILLVLVGGAAYSVGYRRGQQAALRVAVPQQVVAPAPEAKIESAPLAALAQPPAPVPATGTQTVSGEGGPASNVSGTIGPVAAAVDAGAVPGPRTLALTLSGSLDEAVEGAVTTGEGPALALVLSRLLVWWMHPARDVRPGDKLWAVYDTPAGQEPLVLGLRYQSQKIGATHTAVRYQPPGSAFARYYDENGDEIEERLVDSPLDDYEQITSLLRDGRGHKGVDFKTPTGTEVHSPVDGTVTRRNWNFRSNGDCVAIEDRATHRELLFLHLSWVAPEIHPGAVIKKGQAIAKTGNTGHTTAPHLHYQMMSPDQRVLDPFAVQPTTRRKLDAAQLPGFKKALAEINPRLGVS